MNHPPMFSPAQVSGYVHREDAFPSAQSLSESLLHCADVGGLAPQCLKGRAALSLVSRQQRDAAQARGDALTFAPGRVVRGASFDSLASHGFYVACASLSTPHNEVAEGL